MRRRGRGQSAKPDHMAGPTQPTNNRLHYTPRAVFSLKGSKDSPAFLPLLLILCGDIETNPGPTYRCPTCNASNWKQGGVKCSLCKSWYHHTTKCSGVPYRTNPPLNWVCNNCNTQPQTTNPQPTTTNPQTTTQKTAQTTAQTTTQTTAQTTTQTTAQTPQTTVQTTTQTTAQTTLSTLSPRRGENHLVNAPSGTWPTAQTTTQTTAQTTVQTPQTTVQTTTQTTAQ